MSVTATVFFSPLCMFLTPDLLRLEYKHTRLDSLHFQKRYFTLYLLYCQALLNSPPLCVTAAFSARFRTWLIFAPW